MEWSGATGSSKKSTYLRIAHDHLLQVRTNDGVAKQLKMWEAEKSSIAIL
jgi:hypothetical protein